MRLRRGSVRVGDSVLDVREDLREHRAAREFRVALPAQDVVAAREHLHLRRVRSRQHRRALGRRQDALAVGFEHAELLGKRVVMICCFPLRRRSGSARYELPRGDEVRPAQQRVLASDRLASQDERAARVGPRLAPERARDELVPEARAEDPDPAAALAEDRAEEREEVEDPGLVGGGGVVAPRDDQGAVPPRGDVRERGALARPAPMVLPRLAVRAEEAGQRDRVAVPLGRVLAVEHREAARGGGHRRRGKRRGGATRRAVTARAAGREDGMLKCGSAGSRRASRCDSAR